MSKRLPHLLIGDMIESGDKILIYTAQLTFDDFVADHKTIDAVIRNFEIIGEAANRLPNEFKNSHADIDWNRIRGFRNRIIHNYFGIDYEIVWLIKESFLPDLLVRLRKL
jgi:uncharacterized protein with HEPN domain